MYQKHWTAFVTTSALYANSQAIVKNIIIAITRMTQGGPGILFRDPRGKARRALNFFYF